MQYDFVSTKSKKDQYKRPKSKGHYMKSGQHKYNQLFANELEILERNQQLLDKGTLNPKELQQHYTALVQQYGNLLKSTKKITKMADISQKNLKNNLKRFLRIEKIKVCNGLYWISIPEADVYIQCGAPADSVKHLIKKGLIVKRETQGIAFESGPNVILLSDIPIQNGHFANLAEFPVLQMMYRQGLILPGHPNNMGHRPILMGSKDQVVAQSEYIFRGNYGLINREEIMEAGISQEIADEIMQMKMKFAFGEIKSTDSFIGTRIIEDKPVEILNEVFIERMALNRYLIRWKGNQVTVDLNLEENQEYECPYQLGIHTYQKDYFSVIHTGEGDGWNVNHPCMSSILISQGKIYLIDAGPNIMATLISLGISIDEIEGIFHTHGHDDHFSGLTTLILSSHRIKYYATKLVRLSVMKKMSMLMSIKESHFTHFFDIHDLEFDQWNSVGELQVKPVLSPHPIENNNFLFRSMGSQGYRVYAHLADTISFDTLDGMMTNQSGEFGVSPQFVQRIKEIYKMPVDLKKIDVGGGLIHGKAEDFKGDSSNKIVLSHLEREYDDEEKLIGSSAYFGMQSILIKSRKDYFMQDLNHYLESYFPTVSSHSLDMVSNCSVIDIEAGDIFIRKETPSNYIYLIVEGVAEYLDPRLKLKNKITAGTLIGMLEGLTGDPFSGTYRAVSYIKALQIPSFLYLEFVKKNHLYQDLRKNYEKISFLQQTSLFGEIVSFSVQNRIAREMKQVRVRKGKDLSLKMDTLAMVVQGSFDIFLMGKKIKRLKSGGYWGEDSVLFDCNSQYKAVAIEDAQVYFITQALLRDIPVVQWKLLEMHNKRMQM